MAGIAVIALFKLPYDVLSCGPLAVALVTGVLSLEAAGRLRPWRGLVFLGDASYSIYIWHTFAISVIAKLGAVAGFPAGAVFVAAVFGGTALGSAAYLLLERPLAKYLRSPKSAPGSNLATAAAKEAPRLSS
jgi:exopolysaccharide production protein ExoZ